MPLHVVDGATLKCSLGTSPSKLKVVRPGMLIMGKREANVMDSEPIKNVIPFGKCKCSGCASIKACKPETSGPWQQVVPPVVGRSQVSLLQPAILKCGHGGVISIVNPGQQKQSARSPKQQEVNIKAEVNQKILEHDFGQGKLEASLKSEILSNPTANQSFNINSMQTAMTQELNGATLQLNSSGGLEIGFANGSTISIPGLPSSVSVAPNGLGATLNYPLGQMAMANGGMMNSSLAVTLTANPLAMTPVGVTIPSLTPAQMTMLSQALRSTATGAVAVGGAALSIGGKVLQSLFTPLLMGGV